MTEAPLIPPELQGWPIFVLIVWAELRFLPYVLDAIGWLRALGAASNVTEDAAKAARPKGWRFRAAGAPILVFALLMVGCGNPELREATRQLRKTWDTYRASVSPVTSGDADLANAINEGLDSIERAGD